MIDVSDLVGVPFKVHGRNVEDGVDCYGLAIEVERRYGIHLVDVLYDSIEPDSKKSTMELVFGANKFERSEFPQEGCLAAINGADSPHCGVCLGEGLIIHATRNLGVVVQKAHRLNVDGYYRVVK